MKTEVMTITPAMAEEMLRKNTGNRRLSKERVAHLAREISMGNWQNNGETIKLNGERLLDGQHRLSAVVMSGRPIETLVVSGLPTSVFATIDQQQKRGAHHVLHINGEVNSNNLAATIRTILDLRDDGIKWKRSSRTIPNGFFIDFLNEEPEVRDSVLSIHSRMKTVWQLCRGVAIPAALHYLFGQTHPSLRDQFFQRFNDGIGVMGGDPIFVLRQRLIQNAASAIAMDRTMLMAIIIKAWNATVEGRQIRQLKWLPDQEDFPAIASK